MSKVVSPGINMLHQYNLGCIQNRNCFIQYHPSSAATFCLELLSRLCYQLPLLDYECVVWMQCAKRNAERLERLQNQAMRIILQKDHYYYYYFKHIHAW